MTSRLCAFALDDGETAYFFRGGEYLRFDLRARRVDEGYPMAVAEGWEGLWEEGIDAALVVDARTAYFFRGAEYVRWNLARDGMDEGYPRAIAEGWEGLWGDGIDAAFATGDGTAYFFRGAEYVRWDLEADAMDEAYPLRIDEGWDGVWPEGIDAALRVGRKVHFVRDGLATRFDLPHDRADRGLPRPLADAFPGVWSAREAPTAASPEAPHEAAFAEVLTRFERVAQESQGEARVGAVFFAEDPAPAVRARCEALGARFTDPEFVPGPSSVVSPLDDDDDYNDAMREIARRCEWLRPDALAARAGAPEATLFDAAGASSGDLAQGETGDCWLLGAFAALAERHPAWLREGVFGAAALDPWGVCSVRLRLDGRDAWLLIDDRIPWDPVSARPAFVRSTAKGELWPLLLEKAFAKWAGCWQHLRGGLQGDVVPLGDEALRALVGGGDVATVHWRDRNHEGYVHRDALWPVLASWMDAGRVVTAGCADGARGLVSDHVYSLLRLAEVPVAGAPRRFVCLRNPWASGEWRGDWGHRSPRWRDDPAARALLAAGLVRDDERARDDGAFVMAWEDFVRHFEDAAGLEAPPTSAHGEPHASAT